MTDEDTKQNHEYPANPFLAAYRIAGDDRWRLRPAPLRRSWMDTFKDRWPYRCLPLNIANQAGWEVLCPLSFEVTWDGREGPDALKIEFAAADDPHVPSILSHFGNGIVTFVLPWLFRTREPLGLLVRGPSNYWLDGAAALDGWVESWGLEASFTMNWKLTRPGNSVRFDEGSPVCLLQPIDLSLMERIAPIEADIEAEQELAARFHRWRDRRYLFSTLRRSNQSQNSYLRGRDEEGDDVSGHRTAIKLRPFDCDDGSDARLDQSIDPSDRKRSSEDSGSGANS